MTWEDVIAQRFASGHRYLQLLRRPNRFPWRQNYNRYCSGELSLEEAMVLAHPEWLPPYIQPTTILGDPTFTAVAGGSCQSQRLWGYECDVPRSGALHGDHLFPRSLGGPTAALNRLTLCSVHNWLKGADVHLYPWEAGEPAWLRPVLDRYSEFILQ
jgi:hypothetical protein